jgi:hypothetical protein
MEYGDSGAQMAEGREPGSNKSFYDRYQRFRSRAEGNAATRAVQTQEQEERAAALALETEQQTVNREAIERARQQRQAEQYESYVRQFGHAPMAAQSNMRQGGGGNMEEINLLRQIAQNTGQGRIAYAG